MTESSNDKNALVERAGTVVSFRARESCSRFQRLYEEAQLIEAEDARSAGEIGYISRAMVQATLPYREPKNAPPAWGRSNGRVSMVIQPGYTMQKVVVSDKQGRGTFVRQEPVCLGYPFGTIPRLLLAWIGREVCQKKSPELNLGNSLTQFMNAIGITSHTGGKNGSITRLRQQTIRLFAARIAILSDPTAAVNWKQEGFEIADRTDLWWDDRRPESPALFESRVVLKERFFNELINHPVPLDMRALRALSGSPMALDIYSWITYRNSTLRRVASVSWEALQMQFGSETVSERKFRWMFREALRSVMVVYPVKVDVTKSSLILYPSPTSVPMLPGRRSA
jgi:hypothetical protein